MLQKYSAGRRCGIDLQTCVDTVELVVATLSDGGGGVFFEFEEAAKPGRHF
jgi:hypothetical protein